MRQAYELQQLQVQKLIMTQSIQQAIAILQMPATDLWAYVQEACMENPLLEFVSRAPREWPLQAPQLSTSREWIERKVRGVGAVSDFAGVAVQAPPSLRQMLLEQVGYLSATAPDVRQALCYLIDCLDDRGYLTCTIEEASEHGRFTAATVREALRLLQEFEPCGVGARDLRECLLLQLLQEESTPAVMCARRMVADHLEDIPGARSLRAMAQMGCSRSEWQAGLAVIQRLDPRPGWRYASGAITYVKPDLSVVRACGRWVVLINDEMLPVLRVSDVYRKMLDESAAAGGQDGDPAVVAQTRDYLHKKSAAAAFLMRSLEARRRTLHRVAEMIAYYQRDFLERGAEHLKPLTLRVVADALMLHESTISRAVSGKYIHTPQGVFELRYFFSSAVQTTSGEVTAGKSVRAAIKRLIEQEDKTEPFTDQQLAQALLQSGVRVSRRTVAKYREEMRLPSSGARRRTTQSS